MGCHPSPKLTEGLRKGKRLAVPHVVGKHASPVADNGRQSWAAKEARVLQVRTHEARAIKRA